MERTACREGAEVACGLRETTRRRRQQATMEAVQEPQHSGLLSYGTVCRGPRGKSERTDERVARTTVSSLSFERLRQCALRA